jgi:hypothetical protein
MFRVPLAALIELLLIERQHVQEISGAVEGVEIRNLQDSCSHRRIQSQYSCSAIVAPTSGEPHLASHPSLSFTSSEASE